MGECGEASAPGWMVCRGARVSEDREGKGEVEEADLFDEVADDFAAEDVLGVVPQPEDVVRAQALRHVRDPLALVELGRLAVLVPAAGRDGRERAREEVVEVGGECRFDAVYALPRARLVTGTRERTGSLRLTHCDSSTNALPSVRAFSVW